MIKNDKIAEARENLLAIKPLLETSVPIKKITDR